MSELEDAWPAKMLPAAGAELFVRDTGEATLPPIVFLHGLGGYAAEWWPTAEYLHGSYRLIAFDQRGQGQSTNDPSDVSREAFVRDVIAVVEHFNCAPVTLVGQSMGAHTALLAASCRPDLVSRIVLIEGGLGGEGPDATGETINWFRQWPTAFRTRADAAQWFESNGYSPNAATWWAKGLSNTTEGLVPRFVPEVLEAQLRPVHLKRRSEEWQLVTVPTLLIKGADGFIPQQEFDEMLATNPRASFVEVASSGHDMHLDAPEKTASLIRGHMEN